MRLRELAGHINRAPIVRVFVRYGDENKECMYLPVRRSEAKAILEHAKENDVEEIDAEVNAKGEVFIGEMYDLETDADADEEEEEEEDDD